MNNKNTVITMHKWKYRMLSDEALMIAYSKGQADAFECLYLRHKRRVFLFLHRQYRSTEIAEELVHDTWLAVINQAVTYKKAKLTLIWH